MTLSSCPDTTLWLAAARRGELAPAGRAHLASCAACTEAWLVDSALHRYAATAAPRLPDPGLLLYRARLRQRAARQRWALRALGIWQTVAAVSAVTAGAVLAINERSRLWTFFAVPAQPSASEGLALFAVASLLALGALWLHVAPTAD